MSIRVLLHMQDELSELEQRLRALDTADWTSGNAIDLYSLHSRRNDQNIERKAIMTALERRMYQYQKRLYIHSQCLKMEKARDMYADSVSHWIDGRKPVVEEESHWIDERDDLASLGLKVEDYHLFEKWAEEKFSRVFVTKNRPLFGEEVRFYSSTTIRRVVRCFLTLISVIILIGPLFALSYTERQEYRLTLIACFSLVFASAIAFVTKSRNFEVFVATAAYAAVLVVFVGNNYEGQ
ncbi:uncharacterized protein Z519_09300 [Cladophialophora bantiana CBS 173.52]|uniref:Unplaced genomic scaffold supercont1.15, whole genome shotgun sequence n=1 Tax=Cladophialophora bantiana (strain ATCC 10958 / CBS 173.52 / CDC B-1940 / NIH 8579) TaxID=1442370 RepID=A0A0D2EIH6_CLAB1|nr:uncharacterized protein Z519_09300 [Cladophialophora bantiana CBS 173.52]KIW89871.1 hypothetical protein Z519_09300 [Cladophialophora bantiana CBS 173.52]